MKRNSMRWLCGWLVLCLLLGMVSVGLAEEEVVVELEQVEEADSDGMGLELDMGETVEVSGDAEEGLTLDDADLSLDLDDGFDIADNLVLSEDTEAQENAPTQTNASPIEDFEIDEKDVLVVYKGAGGDVVIPDGVTTIGEEAFFDCRSLTSVTIPDSVTSIGNKAFWGCTSLTSVTIPDSVTSIGDFVFYTCSSLTSVTIPNGVTSINTFMFASCSSLTSVVIPDSVISIDYAAFSGCTSLTNVTIGSGVTSIGKYAFCGCDSLKVITVPDNVTDIGEGAFKECEELKNVTIGKGGIVIPKSCFKQCNSLQLINIPDGFFYIDEEAFSECINLKNVHIGIPLDPMKETPRLIELDDIDDSEEAFDVAADLILWSMYLYTHFPGYPINENAFSGCSKDLTFYTRCDTSPTERAKELGYNVVQSDHSPAVIKGEAPTETEYGKTDGVYCSACGKILVEQEDIPPLGSTSKINLSQCKITVKPQVYTGKALKPSVKVVLNKKTLKKGTDYTVTYKNNKAIGTATVTVKGKGSYTGTKKATFKINPKVVTGLKLTAGKGLINAGWKKSAGGVGGYQLQYSLKKSFSGAKKVTVAKAATVKKVLKGLATGKTYYVRIRAYKKVGKTTYYSAWSAAKTAKVK